MEKNTQYEKMTNTPVEKLILMLSVPTIISMMVTNIYNLVDTSFVGRLGTSANGAVGVVFGFMSILQAIGFMFGQGSGSIISRRLGNKDIDGASITASVGVLFSFLFGLVVGIVGLIIPDTVVNMLSSTDTILPYAKKYIFWLFLAAPFATASFTLNNILRYEGKAALGMIGLLTGAILNIFGDYMLMVKYNFGISGAGISTAVSQVISFFILLSMFLLKKTQSVLSLKNVCVNIGLFDIMFTGFPSMLRQALNSITIILLNKKANPYGDAAIAAMSNVSRIMFFIFSIAIGIGQGFQPVSGFNYGAKKYSRLRKAYKFTLYLSLSVMVVAASIVYINGESFLQFLNEDAEVVEIGLRALHLQCMAHLFLPICMVSEMTMQSTGKRLSASILSSLRGGLIFIPALLILSYCRGLAGIQEAQPLAMVLSVPPSIFVSYLYFKKLPKKDFEEGQEQ